MDALRTSLTLLERLRSSGDQQAWNRFYDTYWRIILSFAQQRGLDDQAARDVLQETMIHAMRTLRDFEYNPSKEKFRNWLLTVARFKSMEALREQRRAIPEAEPEARIEDMAPDQDQAAGTDEEQWRLCLLAEALRRIKEDPRVKPENFAIFRAYAIEERPIAEISLLYGATENAIYQIKNRFIGRLKREIQALSEGRLDEILPV